ncbi:hypothetical protein CQZ98_22195 [Pseudomonas sp. MYb115]|nr:hypothetical protein CQZ98_22195 [Pseudomonas sp. MYb115]
MVVNENARCLDVRGGRGFFASRLAPTRFEVMLQAIKKPTPQTTDPSFHPPRAFPYIAPHTR